VKFLTLTFILLSLEVAEDNDEWKLEIISWWDEKLPIVMSVDGEYSFYAIDLSNRINFCH